MVAETIGHYQIVEELGRGGMGVVYLARDTRLERSVAIKALPEHLASDPERLDRFRTEARLLAQLNHPNVAGIHGLEQQGEDSYLILEYVEGESLAGRLARGPLAVDEAVSVARQIALGVEAAHGAGVIHRDLKPDNIRITPRGEVKVLDFGLARSTAPDQIDPAELAASPTIENSPTLPGVILGTAAYMSPEQARGRPVDRRTDVWSFGVVLYECLTGIRPFAGETPSDSIGAILHKEIEFDELPQSTPRRLRRLLRFCLQREVADRYRDMGDVELELREVLNEEPGAGGKIRGVQPARVTAITLIAAVMAAALGWALKPESAPTASGIVDTEISIPAGQRLAHWFQPGIALSPDGQTLAFFTGDIPRPEARAFAIAPQRLMMRHLSQSDAVAVPGGETFGAEPCFSPDGRWLAYWTSEGMYKIPVTGGDPQLLAAAENTMGLSWAEGGMIVAGRGNGGLVRFSPDGGVEEELSSLDVEMREKSHSHPHILPGAQGILFTVQRFGYQMRAPTAWSIWVLDLRTRERRLLVEHASHASYLDGSIVFLREAALYAAPFDLNSLEITGTPRLLLDGVQHSIYSPSLLQETGAGQYALSANGTLAFVEGSVVQMLPSQILRVDNQGNATPIEVQERPYISVRAATDGSQIVMSVHYPPSTGVWTHELDRGVTRHQRTGAQGHIAFFGPGPDDLSYDETDGEGIRRNFHKPIGAAQADALTEIPAPPLESIWTVEWSRDGSVLLGYNISGAVLWSYTETDGWAEIPGQHPDGAMWPTLSPDGRWLAYGALIEYSSEIMVQPFGHNGSTAQISTSGGREPIWSHDGQTLYFRTYGTDDQARQVLAVSITDAGDRIEVGPARELFEESHAVLAPWRSWDLLGDDEFVFISAAEPEQHQENLLKHHGDRIRVIQNWASRLR